MSDPTCRQPPAVDPYAAWRIPGYRRYAASWFLLTFGKMVETVAVLVHVHDRSAARDLSTVPLALGLIGLVQALPVFLLAIAGGQIADRYDRRRVIMAMLGVGTVVSVGLAMVSLAQLAVGWLYLLLGVGAVAQALGSPSRAALLPQIVPAERFATAVAWNSTVFQVASMTGPAIGGLVVGLSANASAAFVLVAVCRLSSFAAIATLRCRSQERSAESVSLESLVAGIKFVWRSRLILATITLDLFAVLLGGVTYLLPIFAEQLTRSEGSGVLVRLAQGVAGQSVGSPEAVVVGLLRSAEAVGAVCMAVLLAHLPPMKRAGRTMLWAVAGFGAATIVFGLSQSLLLSLAMMLLIGALDNISVVVRHTLVQMLTPDAMRGRVSAVNGIFIVASNDLGGLESGLTAWLFTPVIAVVGGGIGTILVVLAAARAWPEILRIGSLNDVRPADGRPRNEEGRMMNEE
jgi:MFS family permease